MHITNQYMETAVPEAMELAELFSVRAEELRGIADHVRTPEIRAAMLRWAADYDLFAKRAAALATSPTNTQKQP